VSSDSEIRGCQLSISEQAGETVKPSALAFAFETGTPTVGEYNPELKAINKRPSRLESHYE